MAKASEGRPRALESMGAQVRPEQYGAPKPWTLSPTDLTFLWDECPRCFYNKVALGRPRPRAPFPRVFGLIDRAMKDFYLGARAETLVPGMAPGVIVDGDRWVKTAPIVPPGASSSLVIRGRVDVLVACDDGTTAVVDFKTVEPGPAAMEKYARQLHAYAAALEHPARGPATTVSALGLVCFLPDRFQVAEDRAVLRGGLEWIAVPRDDGAFEALLGQVASVLAPAEPPPPAPGCAWCARDRQIPRRYCAT